MVHVQVQRVVAKVTNVCLVHLTYYEELQSAPSCAGILDLSIGCFQGKRHMPGLCPGWGRTTSYIPDRSAVNTQNNMV